MTRAELCAALHALDRAPGALTDPRRLALEAAIIRARVEAEQATPSAREPSRSA